MKSSLSAQKKITMSTVTYNARRLRLPEEKLLGDYIVCIPGFTLEKYRKLQRSRLSIFSMTCFGGILSHNLGLLFLTPFINMSLRIKDYMCFLQSAYSCMKEELTLKEIVLNNISKQHYLIATLGNVDIVLNHDSDFDVAKKKWDECKQKIN